MRRPSRFEVTAAALVSVAALAGAVVLSREKECASERAISPFYPPAPGATTDRTTWPGIDVAVNNMPPGAKLRAGFRGGPEGSWNDSQPYLPDPTTDKTALLRGDGPVQYSLRYVRETKAWFCTVEPPPETDFPQQPTPAGRLLLREELIGTFPSWQ